MNLLLKAIIKPHRAIKYAVDFIAGFYKIDLHPINLIKYLIELYRSKDFWQHINEKVEEVKRNFPDPKLGGWMLGYPCILLYAIVRVAKPKVVVETGVGPGGSSALILLALERNKQGQLFSIDLPGADALIYPKIGKNYNIHVPPGYEVGWLVPSWLRSKWRLFLGDSKELLPKLVENLGEIDMFLHDSLHTDECVTFELLTVFPYLKKEGLLLADDVNEYWSMAFKTFCEEKSIPYTIFYSRLGVARKK